MGTRRKAMVVPRTGFHQRRAGSMEPRRFAARPLPLRELLQPLPPRDNSPVFLGVNKRTPDDIEAFCGERVLLSPPNLQAHGLFFCCTRATI